MVAKFICQPVDSLGEILNSKSSTVQQENQQQSTINLLSSSGRFSILLVVSRPSWTEETHMILNA